MTDVNAANDDMEWGRQYRERQSYEYAGDGLRLDERLIVNVAERIDAIRRPRLKEAVAGLTLWTVVGIGEVINRIEAAQSVLGRTAAHGLSNVEGNQ